MRHLRLKKIYGAAAAVVLLIVLFVFLTGRREVDFNAEVKPILNKKCITCHGGIRQQGGFSLLFRSEALAKTESGKYGIIPGDPQGSEMIRRLHLDDPEERMPYKESPLSQSEIDILTRWIRQGAPWGDHWAYVPVKPVEPPEEKTSFFGFFSGKKNDFVKNNIDHFIQAGLNAQDLKPAAEADKATLLRRVSLDLTGLPAATRVAERYLHSNTATAYEQLVDSLLAAPQFGEKWAALWMDLARYADTKGYERDAGRNIWKYRDWLIRSFNEDKPYDVFLTEQIAGDLLPEATDEQLIATAFHRNTMTNDEGGTDNEEFRTAAVIDRVNTTWEGVLGTTFACVQCHSHPYDPFKHEEYYQFLAFFNNTRDEDTWGDYPVLRHYSGEDSLQLAQIVDWLKKNNFEKEATAARSFLKTWQPTVNSLLADSFTNCELNDTKWLAMRNHSTARLKNINLEGKSQLVYRYLGLVPGGIWTIRLDRKDGPVLAAIAVQPTRGWTWTVAKKDLPATGGVHDLWFSYSSPHLTNPDATGLQFDWFYFTNELPGKEKAGYDSIAKHYWQLANKEPASTPIMMDNPADMHRPTHVFDRGNWLVKGKLVQPGVPASMNAFPANAPRNRLGLAQWMTDKNNPLTARAMVNRVWEQLFGTGLVETLEDLGTQGAEPTHRELLDHLAYRFMHDMQWSVKKLIREMVLSATYRQDSRISEEGLKKDPLNKWFGRSPRIRLSAEQVRDQALAYAGLLSPKMNGPSVMPWQPEGIWMSPWNGASWAKSEGEDQYRRSLYTYWKRTAPYPSMITFDGVGREVCVARRIRTNTPLQALVTLNDSVYLEAARHLAIRMKAMAADGKNIRTMISGGYQNMLYKPISAAKLNVLEYLYHTAYATYRNDAEKTCAMIGVNNEHNNPETAALVVVANAMLNLDEIVMKN